MEEEQVMNIINPEAVSHLLQHTLRSLCLHDNSQWVYAVFWRILPRNYPPPKWEGQIGGTYAHHMSRGNKRNWMLVWEDGFCNFAASAAIIEPGVGECHDANTRNNNNNNSSELLFLPPHDDHEFIQGGHLQPQVFFKMSHEIYNFGEGLMGKVAADFSHKWIHKEPLNNDQDHRIINSSLLSAWHNSADLHPRTWAAQFQSGVKTIALIAVREGVVQLGSLHKVVEDLSYVVLLRKRFSYIESIPGVLLPHPSWPSSSASPPLIYPLNIDANNPGTWHFRVRSDDYELYNNPNDDTSLLPYNNHQSLAAMKITPSMTSLEALLSKLPSVVLPPGTSTTYSDNNSDHLFVAHTPPLELMGLGDQEKVAKHKEDEVDR